MTGKDCRRVQQLWLDEADGKPLSADDLALLDEHRERCGFCRAEEDWLQAAGLDAATGPAPEMDDLESRRWIDDVLDRAEEPVAKASKPRTRLFGMAAAAALLLLMGSAGLWWILQEPQEQPEPFVEQEAILQTTDPAQLLLLSGGSATLAGAEPQVGDALPADAELTVAGGRAVVQLQEGLRVSLEQGSIAYQPTAEEGVAVTLDTGQLYMLADPERPGGPIDVHTHTGTVRITGTYLSVEAGAHGVAVEVYRGNVEVMAGDGEPQRVTAGQRYLIGDDRLTTIDDATDRESAQIQDLLQLLGQSRYSAVEIHSLPRGATVSLDGCPLGETPLTAHVVAGEHKLEVEAERHVPAREFIQLVQGVREVRTIELMALAAFDETPAAPVIAEAPVEDPMAAAELLQQAQGLRAERAWTDAAATYRQLTEQYPESPEARASWVSLGSIRLDHLGQPAEALRCFDTYLAVAPAGSLAQEASFERARALRALGDRTAETEAWRLFLDRFPDALEAPMAHQYLEELP